MNNILKQPNVITFSHTLTRLKMTQRKLGSSSTNLLLVTLATCGTNINKLEFNSEEINDICEISEAFNAHFTKIGETVANKIPKTDTDSISYLKPTNNIFSFKTIDVNQVKLFLEKLMSMNRVVLTIYQISCLKWLRKSYHNL